MKLAICYPTVNKTVVKPRWVHAAAVRMGHSVRHVVTVADLAAADMESDVVLFHQYGGGFNPADLVDVPKRSRWLCWWWDCIAREPALPLAEQQCIRAFGDFLRRMDTVFVKERSLLAEFGELGINARYLDQGSPADYPACSGARQFDVLLFGSLQPEYQQRRRDVTALVNAGFNVAWAGAGWRFPAGVTGLPWCHPDNLPALMGRAAVALVSDFRHDVPGYWSDRFWLAMGAGACVVKRFTPGQPDGPYVTYHDETELVNVTRQLIHDTERCRALGAAAREWTLAHHTYRHRLQEIIECIA